MKTATDLIRKCDPTFGMEEVTAINGDVFLADKARYHTINTIKNTNCTIARLQGETAIHDDTSSGPSIGKAKDSIIASLPASPDQLTIKDNDCAPQEIEPATDPREVFNLLTATLFNNKTNSNNGSARVTKWKLSIGYNFEHGEPFNELICGFPGRLRDYKRRTATPHCVDLIDALEVLLTEHNKDDWDIYPVIGKFHKKGDRKLFSDTCCIVYKLKNEPALCVIQLDGMRLAIELNKKPKQATSNAVAYGVFKGNKPIPKKTLLFRDTIPYDKNI